MCLDETSKQLVQETRTPLPPRPGAAMAYDHEYQRNGVSNLFMLFAPLEGWRRVEVTDRRTRTDWAEVVRRLVDEDYPDKERIVLVMDRHPPSSVAVRGLRAGGGTAHRPAAGDTLHAEARELAQYSGDRTGGAGACLDRRIPSQEDLAWETWQGQRNRAAIRAWRFTTGTPVSRSPSTRQSNSGGLLGQCTPVCTWSFRTLLQTFRANSALGNPPAVLITAPPRCHPGLKVSRGPPW